MATQDMQTKQRLHVPTLPTRSNPAAVTVGQKSGEDATRIMVTGNDIGLHADLCSFVFLDVHCPLFLIFPEACAIAQKKLSTCKQSKRQVCMKDLARPTGHMHPVPNLLPWQLQDTWVAGMRQALHILAAQARQAHPQMRILRGLMSSIATTNMKGQRPTAMHTSCVLGS